MIDSKRRTALACLLVLVPLGCSAAPRTAVQPTSRSACTIAGTASAAPDSVTVAVNAPIDVAHAPIPATAAERFAFAQMFETLINVDCEGHAYPGLARSWTMDATRTRVTLLIRDGARFSGGKPVVASDVVAAWRASGRQSTDASELARRLADATTVLDDHTLTVSLPDTAWLVLAEPALAVYQPQSAPAWPEGSGPYRVDPGAASDSRLLTLSPVIRGAGPRIVLRTRASGDARDAIDAGSDLVVTGDPVAVSYAATHGDLTAIPLPWSRTYALAVRGHMEGIRAPGEDSLFREMLARDAVHGEARAAESPHWWIDVRTCPNASGSAPINPGNTFRALRIVYPRDDRIAREIAERLVAVGHRVTTAGLAPDDFARALHAGDEFAFVLDLPRTALSPCEDFAELAATAPWVAGNPSDTSITTRLRPLIDTRQRAIVRPERVSAEIDWDGTLRFGGPGHP